MRSLPWVSLPEEEAEMHCL
uniref:Uncharacterized protein n=1 Tax=Anguilla anguilla TaxID=7936 RepID=A0A0E9RWN5_ANGAN